MFPPKEELLEIKTFFFSSLQFPEQQQLRSNFNFNNKLETIQHGST
jgi:hypothetical protein